VQLLKATFKMYAAGTAEGISTGLNRTEMN